MSLFVDASALVAIIADEAERERFASTIRDEAVALWSAMSCWEAISGLRSVYDWPIGTARDEVEATAERFGMRLVAIAEMERAIALEAYQRYGKGTRHPARLNMGDCFAYACAKTSNARLLYKGNDFAHTDLA